MAPLFTLADGAMETPQHGNGPKKELGSVSFFFQELSEIPFLGPFPIFRKSCKFSVCCSVSTFLGSVSSFLGPFPVFKKVSNSQFVDRFPLFGSVSSFFG